MNKKLALFLVGIVLLSLIGCAPQVEEPIATEAAPAATEVPAQPAAVEPREYVLAFSWATVDVMMRMVIDGLQASADAYNANSPDGSTVKIIYTDAQGNLDKQLADVDSLIAQHPDVIQIRPIDIYGIEPAFTAAKEAGIPTVEFDSAVSKDASYHFEMLDHNRLGEVQAQWLEDYLAENPDAVLNIGYLNANASQSAGMMRRDGFVHEITSQYGADRINIISEHYANWSTEQAMTTTEDWLQAFPELNTIVAANDEMALGAVQAVNAATKTGEIFILGMDGIDGAMQAVKDGTMSATIKFFIDQMLNNTFNVNLSVAQGKGMPEFEGDPFVVVDSTNINEYLP